MPSIEDRLASLGITLPEPVAPVANYVPFVRAGDLVHISGQISIDASGGIKGVVKAAREARRPAVKPNAASRARAALASRPALASVSISTSVAAGDYVTLLARATAAGTLDIVASIDGQASLTERAIRAAAA